MICSEDKKYVDMIRTYSYPLVPVPVSEEVLEPFRSRVPRLNGSFLQYPVILFDIYGTLFQSGSGDIGVFEQYREGRCALFPRGELSLLQERFASAVRDRHKKQGKTVEVPEVRVEEIWAELQNLDLEAAREFALRFELSVNPVYPMPGAKELFGLLQKRGIILGLVSNAQFFTPCYFEAFFSVSLEEMGFREDLCVFSFQAGEAKPSLQLFRFAAEVLLKYGFKAENCLLSKANHGKEVYALYIIPNNGKGIQSEDGNTIRVSKVPPKVKPKIFIIYTEDSYSKHCKRYKEYTDCKRTWQLQLGGLSES